MIRNGTGEHTQFGAKLIFEFYCVSVAIDRQTQPFVEGLREHSQQPFVPPQVPA